MLDFNKIVNKLGKKGGNVITKSEIYTLIDPEKKVEYQNQVDKCIYRLKSQGVIIALKAGMYIVPMPEDRDQPRVDIIENYYFKFLKKVIRQHAGSRYYISGMKSLQLQLKDMSISQKIYVMTPNIQKKVTLGPYEIIFKTISGKEMGKKVSLFPKYEKFTLAIDAGGVEFKCSGRELALVESTLLQENYSGVELETLVKHMKRYAKYYDLAVFHEIGKYKYNMSFNRLKEIAKPLDTTLYETFLQVIKENGNCFVGEGMRGM